MAQGRFISSTVAEDIRLNGLSLEAQLVYLMSIPHLDVDGIMAGHPSLVFARACPLRTELREQIPAIIDEWCASGLVIRYDSDGQEALFFTGFPKNQKVRRNREAASKFTAPPGYVRDESVGLVLANAGSAPGAVLANSPASTSTSASISLSLRAATLAAAASDPPESSDSPAWQAYRENINPDPPPMEIAQVDGLIAQHGERDMLKAIAIAVKRKRCTLGYVEGILQRGVDSKPPKGVSNGTYSRDDGPLVEPVELDPEIVRTLAENRARLVAESAAQGA